TLVPDLVQRQVEYWRTVLPAGLPSPDFLATGPMGTSAPGTAAILDTVVPDAVAESLGALAGQHRMTAFGVFQTAVQVLAYRYTGCADVVLGTTTLNRKRPEFESAMGFFANTVAFHTPLGDNPSFAVALERGRN